MKVFISGGSKSGKSMHAQRIAKELQGEGKPLYYLATMIPSDVEDLRRISKHIEERNGWDFETVEAGKNIYEAVSCCDMKGTFLLDSVTALLANEMFCADGEVKSEAYKAVAGQLKDVAAAVENIVIVSDNVYSDGIQYDNLTEQYRQGLAYIDKEMAKTCDLVLESCYGNLTVHNAQKESGFFEYTFNSPRNDGGK